MAGRQAGRQTDRQAGRQTVLCLFLLALLFRLRLLLFCLPLSGSFCPCCLAQLIKRAFHLPLCAVVLRSELCRPCSRELRTLREVGRDRGHQLACLRFFECLLGSWHCPRRACCRAQLGVESVYLPLRAVPHTCELFLARNRQYTLGRFEFGRDAGDGLRAQRGRCSRFGSCSRFGWFWVTLFHLGGVRDVPEHAHTHTQFIARLRGCVSRR